MEKFIAKIDLLFLIRYYASEKLRKGQLQGFIDHDNNILVPFLKEIDINNCGLNLKKEFNGEFVGEDARVSIINGEKETLIAIEISDYNQEYNLLEIRSTDKKNYLEFSFMKVLSDGTVKKSKDWIYSYHPTEQNYYVSTEQGSAADNIWSGATTTFDRNGIMKKLETFGGIDSTGAYRKRKCRRTSINC